MLGEVASNLSELVSESRMLEKLRQVASIFYPEKIELDSNIENGD